MSTITMNINKSTVTASAHLPYGAYKRADELARAYEGKIGRTEENRFTVTFDKVKTAKKFVSEWTADYTEAHKAYTPKHTEPKAPKTTKQTKPSSSKKNGKGNGFDFGKIKGKTNSDKNKALHKALVGMGITDSRTSEYTNVWNARPWAK